MVGVYNLSTPPLNSTGENGSEVSIGCSGFTMTGVVGTDGSGDFSGLEVLGLGLVGAVA